MKNLLRKLKHFLGRVKEVCSLSSGQWKWITTGILMITAIILLGLWSDMAGVVHFLVFLLVISLLVVLSMLAGLGVKLGLRILRILPERFNWIYFGAVFFIFFFFGLTLKSRIVLSLWLIFAGASIGAGLYNLTGGRWGKLRKIRKVLTILFFALGSSIFLLGAFFLVYPGKGQDEERAWALESTHLPELLLLDDPSLPGPFRVDSLTYGWGKDKRRPEFGEEADIITGVVDGSNFLDGWKKLSGKLRTKYWGMKPDSLALNGRVWYPVGEGPFPLVLMVHGNHLDRDFSDPGYGYLGKHFASLGIIAVSVDENFLNGSWSDFSKGLEKENDCRGWLLLKHLELWRGWNGCDTSRFYHRLDMERIVLIGHSRGGEAVSIASCFNVLPYYPDKGEERFDFNFGIKGVAAIAPVDGQYWPAGIETPVRDVNYFTLQGSMDADLRSFDGMRQMHRVQFSDSLYHFAAGIYIHGANHGQFNRTWGRFDIGYPDRLMINRKAIIPVEQQEKTALVYLTAFVLESIKPGKGYIPLFRDYRSGRDWLPGLVFLNQFHESTAQIICDYDEDLDLQSGTLGIDSIYAGELALWKEGRIPKKWGDLRNNGVFLGWNNEKDSVPGSYTIVMDSAYADRLGDVRYLSFLAADGQIDPGERPDTSSVKEEPEEEAAEETLTTKSENNVGENEEYGKNGKEEDKKGRKEEKEDEDKEPEPVDFSIVLTDRAGMEYRVQLGDYLKLHPPIKPEVFKSRLFRDEPESEVILQYVDIPLEAFRDQEGPSLTVQDILSLTFLFDQGEKGTVILDQIGFTR